MRKKITISMLALLLGVGSVFATRETVPDCPVGYYNPQDICGLANNFMCCYVTQTINWQGTQYPEGVIIMGTTLIDP